MSFFKKFMFISTFFSFVFSFFVSAMEFKKTNNNDWKNNDDWATYTALHKQTKVDLGWIAYTPCRCKIDHIHVYDEYQKLGIGTELFEHAVKDMPGCNTVKWFSIPDALPFYLKLGASIDWNRSRYSPPSPEEQSIYIKNALLGNTKNIHSGSFMSMNRSSFLNSMEEKKQTTRAQKKAVTREQQINEIVQREITETLFHDWLFQSSAI